MKHRFGRCAWAPVLFAAAGLVAGGCFREAYRLGLPGGFDVHHVGGQTRLWHVPSGIVVVEDGLAAYGVAERCIVGRLRRFPAEGEARAERSYFLVDLREFEGADPPTGEDIARPDRDPWGRSLWSGVYFGLTLEELGEMLERRGIAEIPELKVPSHKDAEFRLPFPTKVIS